MTRAISDFVDHAGRHLSGAGDPDCLVETLLSTTFFCQAGENPGFLATPSPSGPLIAVFTTEAALARHAGACRWFSASGRDLLALAPVGHRFVIDPGSPHQLIVDPEHLIGPLSGLAG